MYSRSDTMRAAITQLAHIGATEMGSTYYTHEARVEGFESGYLTGYAAGVRMLAESVGTEIDDRISQARKTKWATKRINTIKEMITAIKWLIDLRTILSLCENRILDMAEKADNHKRRDRIR